jgi:aminoglycoside phosphotransferase family enzyme
MIRRPNAHELILGASEDPQFGPVILFGHGGTAAEVIGDRALALPPLNMRLARDLMAQTRIHRLLTDFPRARPEMLIDRHRERRIVEGHGDLRPEHICLEREPVIIDCLEFSRQLRIVDPAEELAFLALECAILGEPEVGVRLQRSYEAMAGDRPPEQLIAWYAGFRALVRARLLALHSLEPGPRLPEAWLAQSKQYLDTGLSYTEALA